MRRRSAGRRRRTTARANTRNAPELKRCETTNAPDPPLPPQAKDYIFRKELAGFKKTATLDRLYEAFSRDGPVRRRADGSIEKTYVQDRMREQGAMLYKLIMKDGGCVFWRFGAKNLRCAHACGSRLFALALPYGHSHVVCVCVFG